MLYDVPVGTQKAQLLPLMPLYQNTDYGKDYRLGTTYETGSMVHAHVGYAILEIKNTVFNLMLLTQHTTLLNDNASQLGIGANAFSSGHNSKLTLGVPDSKKYATNKSVNTVTSRAMIYL
jgi:hypothetical protein